MKSYWFTHFKVSYQHQNGSHCVIEGNAVFTFDSDFFSPSSAIKSLERCYKEKLLNQNKIHPSNKINATIQFVTPITEKAAQEFNQNLESTTGTFSSQAYEVITSPIAIQATLVV